MAFSGKARSAARVSRCAAAISLNVSPALTATVTIGGRRIAFARAMTSPRNASRLALGQGQDARLTLLMSLWPWTVVRLTGSPVALAIAAIRVAQNCFCALVIGYVDPYPTHSNSSASTPRWR